MANVLAQAARELRWTLERVAATAVISQDEAKLILDRPKIDPADLQAGTLGLLKRAFELRGIVFVNGDTEIEGPCHPNQLRKIVLKPQDLLDLERLARAPLQGIEVEAKNPHAFMRGLQHHGLAELGHVVKTATFEGIPVTWAQPEERRIRLSSKGRALCWSFKIELAA